MATIYLNHGAWRMKIYSSVDVNTGLPLADGKRKQQSIYLHAVDETHSGKTSLAVLTIAAEKEKRIRAFEENAKLGEVNTKTLSANTKVADFFNNVFQPARRALSASNPEKLSPSTVTSNQTYWEQYLAPHFNGTKTFGSYRAYMGRQFLTYLRKKDGTPLGENTIKQIKSTASAIFTAAVELEVIDHNPWLEVKIDKIPTKSIEEGRAYTETEVETIIKNLDADMSDRNAASSKAAQIALALAFWATLRPGEIIGLRWENVNLALGELTIKENIVYDKRKGTKTNAERIVALPDADCAPLVTMLDAWKKECGGKDASGWVLQNRDGNPVDLTQLSDRIVYPSCEKNGMGDVWKGNAWYAGRRGGITLLLQHGAEPHDVARFAGNTYSTIEGHYLKDKQNKMGKRAMGAFEENKRKLAGKIRGDFQLTAGAQ